MSATPCSALWPLRSRMRRGVRSVQRLRVAGLVLAGAAMVAGCADRVVGNGTNDPVTLSGAEVGPPAGVGSVDWDAIPDELRAMDISEVHGGAAALHHEVSKLLVEVGVLELLDSYLINVPPSAGYFAVWEMGTAVSASHDLYGASSPHRYQFELRVLGAARDAMNTSPLARDISGALREEYAALHDAFFEVFEQCGRDSPWPEVEMFVMGDGYAGDYWPHLFESDFTLSYFEYKELLHACGRYAATYPTLDPRIRDELLAPQRAHFATTVLDELFDSLPVVEVPSRYLAEIDNLRDNGW